MINTDVKREDHSRRTIFTTTLYDTDLMYFQDDVNRLIKAELAGKVADYLFGKIEPIIDKMFVENKREN